MTIEELREALLAQYGTLMQVYPAAVVELGRIEDASDEELVEMAVQEGLIDE